MAINIFNRKPTEVKSSVLLAFLSFFFLFISSVRVFYFHTFHGVDMCAVCGTAVIISYSPFISAIHRAPFSLFWLRMGQMQFYKVYYSWANTILVLPEIIYYLWMHTSRASHARQPLLTTWLHSNWIWCCIEMSKCWPQHLTKKIIHSRKHIDGCSCSEIFVVNAYHRWWAQTFRLFL